MKVVIDGDVEGNYKTETILKSEVVGDFMAYPESDEGFPSTYEEVQARIMQLLQGAEKNPWLMSVLAEPDTQKVVARYILPDQIALPGDQERSRLKELMHMLSKQEPSMVQGPNGPMPLPSILPIQDVDDLSMGLQVSQQWLQTNWRGQGTPGFTNVLAFFRLCKQQTAEAAAQQQIMQQQAEGGGKPPSGPPPGGPPPPQ